MFFVERRGQSEAPAGNFPHVRSGLQLSCMYSAQLLDHFQNPRNAGDIPNADATVEMENPACGDVLRLTLRIQAGRIVEIRFKAKGCVPSMACGSAMTELIAGRTLDEARNLRRDDLTAAIGGLPEASTHAAQLALDALSAALRQVKTAQ
jgi:nitrogen fixation NifU-like protein